MPTKQWITTQLEADGFSVASIDTLSENTVPKDWAFRVKTAERTDLGDTLYVKTVYPEIAESMATVLKTEHITEIPTSHIIRSDPALVVMEPADGRPLSIILPLFTLPGIWRLKRNELEAGIHRFGRALGKLHTADDVETGLLGNDSSFKSLDQMPGLENVFDSATLSTIEAVFDSASTFETDYCLSHSDPSPHNIFYNSGEIQLIDLSLRKKSFLRDLTLGEIGLKLMIRRLPYGRKMQSKRLIKAFTNGYNQTGVHMQATEQDLHSVVMANNYCQLLSMYSDTSSKSIPTQLTKFTDVSYLKMNTKYLIEELDEVT